MERTATPAAGVVAIGASAGGIEALRQVMAGMPTTFPFAVMVVIHTSRETPSLLAPIMDRSGPLPAVAAVDGAVLEAGRIYAAVPDHHLLTLGHRAALSHAPLEGGHRPAIDALFRSVASDYGSHAIGVLVSGSLADGVAGLHAIRAGGGVTVVQEPADAPFPDLPRNAVRAGVADHVAAARDIAELLTHLARAIIDEAATDPEGDCSPNPPALT